MSTVAVDPVKDYALRVVRGEVPAGKYHRLACARHIRDLGRQGTVEFPWVFDIARATRFFKFAENLRHYKGEWAGQKIILQPHQKFRWGSVFGWVHPQTRLRRLRNWYNEIPRKNGKTLESAVATLYVTFFEGEMGADGACAATKREQALLVFNDCKKLVVSSGLKSRLKVQVGNIHNPLTSSKLEPLSADYNSMDGLNLSMVTMDELHAYKTRGTIDVLETATGARRQPVINKITTAGNDPVSPCGDEHDYACKVLEGVLVDETYFAFIAHADTDDDWTLPSTAAKANPNYGISVNPDDLKAKVVKAKGMPSAAATYKQKHLNLWVNASAPCLSVDGWRKGQSAWDQAELEHESCWVGIDLASKIDICAMSLVFPPAPGRSTWRWMQYLWTPEETLKERAHADRAPYETWVDQGWLRTTPGTRIDHDVIREALIEVRDQFHIELIGYDPWHADKLVDVLVKQDGFTETQLVPVPQTFAGMSSACLRVQADILAGLVDARQCPVTAWAVSNTVDQRDGKDNMQFIKKKSRGRIDPVISAAIGTALWLRQPAVQEPKFQLLFVGGPH